jgi:hypothetical protein
MGKGTFGVLTALAVWCGGALSAEAQSIGVDIVGPLSVVSTDTSMTVVANVTGTTSFNFWVKVKIGTSQKHYSGQCGGSGTQINYPISGLQSWPIGVDTVLDITVKVWCGTTTALDTHRVTVTAPPPPPQTLLPEKLRRAPLRVREDALAWMGRKDFEVIG